MARCGSLLKFRARKKGRNLCRRFGFPQAMQAIVWSLVNPSTGGRWRQISKAVFPLSAANKDATYNWEVGTIERPVEFERQFEVASHHWIDQTDESGSYGATILTDVKNGSDKRDEQHNSADAAAYSRRGCADAGRVHDQLNQDWGHHEVLFGIAGHAGDWREEKDGLAGLPVEHTADRF